MDPFPDKSSEDFANGWITHARTHAGSAKWLSAEWVVGASIEWSRIRPNELLNAILIITAESLSDREVERLGCGPLETYVSLNYEREKETIWELAKLSENFRSALTYVSPEPSFEEDFFLHLGALDKH